MFRTNAARVGLVLALVLGAAACQADEDEPNVEVTDVDETPGDDATETPENEATETPEDEATETPDDDETETPDDEETSDDNSGSNGGSGVG
jgi:hypothetical protein